MKGMLLVIGMVVAGPLAACGGDDALTKAEYVSELSAMCRDFSAREKVIGEPETVADLVEKGPRIVEAFEKAVLNEVSTLEAPDEIAVQADRLVDLAARQRDVLAGLVDAAEAGDLARVQELASKNRAVNREASRSRATSALRAAPRLDGRRGPSCATSAKWAETRHWANHVLRGERLSID